jgi:hypothetical protein
MQTVMNQYSRNGLVCYSTAIGNVAGGLPGYLLLLPAFGIHEAADLEPDHWFARSYGVFGIVVAAVPAMAAGAALGTPFYPDLLPQRRVPLSIRVSLANASYGLTRRCS